MTIISECAQQQSIEIVCRYLEMKAETVREGHSLSRDPKVHAPCFIMSYILTHSREVENNIIKYVFSVCDIPNMYTPAY